jgi:hypothetical protein
MTSASIGIQFARKPLSTQNEHHQKTGMNNGDKKKRV